LDINPDMVSGRIHPRSRLWFLEFTLGIAGCCSLGYCALSGLDAAITQASLARSFEQSRIATNVAARPSMNVPTVHAGRDESQLRGGVAVRLEVPRVGISAFVLDGVGSRTLRGGLGHVPGTSWPGQSGNIVIAGHRDTFFRPLCKIEMCDEVLLDAADRTYHFVVSSIEVVDPHDVSALRFHGKNELTLVTCYPFFYIGPAPKRFVVHAEPLLAQGKCGSSAPSQGPAIP
jgi:sortase A